MPKASSRPFPPIGAKPRYLAITMPGAAVHDATPGEIAAYKGRGVGQKPEDAALFSSGPARSRTWTSPRRGSGFIPQYDLHAELQSGTKVTCKFAACDRIVDLWWPEGSDGPLFLRREGWGNSNLALYSWMPGNGHPPIRLFATRDMLASCQPVDGKLLCLHEGAESPASLRFVSMDGSMTPAVDLNPEFRQLALGKSERLEWRNAYGIETFGDLVLPPGYDGKSRLPLIIVQYDSRGFLRGGTGDEYPIQAFAGRGFAVLSFERPRFVGMSRPAKDGDELFRHNLEGWADLRSVLSSLETIVDQLASRGLINSNRVGISGLSDGTRNTQYADKKGIAASVTYYHNAYKNKITTADELSTTAGGINYFNWENSGPATISGIEGNFTFPVNEVVTWTTNFTKVIKSERESYGQRIDGTTGIIKAPVSLVPEYTINNSLRIAPTKDFGITFRSTH